MNLKNNLVAIHQPNFLPWLGFFDKIIKADTFIFMDNAQFQKKGGTWGNRVSFNFNGKATYITLPVNRKYTGYRTYREMEIRKINKWIQKTMKSISLNYKKAEFYEENIDMFSTLLRYETDNLTDFNLHSIYAILDILEIKETKLVLGSQLNVEGNATNLLISMVKAVNGTGYLCGGGAGGYQEDYKFSENGLSLVYQNFVHPIYHQSKEKGFVPGLSVFDAIFEIGLAETTKILRRNLK